jgi:hypothetical protein
VVPVVVTDLDLQPSGKIFLLDFAANFAGYIISEIRLTVELIEKTLRFKHTDIMKIPELDRVARFF